MDNSDEYLDTFSSFGLPGDGHLSSGTFNANSCRVDSRGNRESLCMNLVLEVQEITDMDELKSRHVSRIIQHNLQRVLDAAAHLGHEIPEANPFAEGQVPYLDFFTGDIRVRVNGLLRKYELHSGKPRVGERLITNDEFASLVYWIDYIIELGNEGEYADVPHALSCLNTWVQTL